MTTLPQVIIENCGVTVYPDSCSTVKPPVGQGLNKTATVHLERYWQISKTNREPIKDPEVLEKMDYIIILQILMYNDILKKSFYGRTCKI